MSIKNEAFKIDQKRVRSLISSQLSHVMYL